MAVANIKSEWSGGSLIFKKIGTSVTTGIEFGVDGTGLDIKMYGDTASSYLLWDQSADKLIIVGGTADLGNSVNCTAYVVGGTAGIDFASGPITNLTINKGIVTYAV